MKTLPLIAALWLGLLMSGQTAPIGVRSLPYEIKASGHYILEADLAAIPGTEGIRIMANDVVLDLCGFTLSTTSVSGNGAAGINISPAKNVTVRNGTIRGFATGLIVLGNNASEMNSAHLFENLRILECRNEGIYIEAGCGGTAIRHCDVLGIGPTSANGTAFAIDLRCAHAAVLDTRVQSTEVGISLLAPHGYVNGNTVTAGTFGIIFDHGGSGLRMNNVVIAASTPYRGGTDGGGNQ